MLLSFIMPIYNAEIHLCEAIDSVLAQTNGDWELLLIDDGSIDASGAICEKYAQQDSRIRVFHLENGGVSRARNYGLERVNGEYIAFVDSDDILTPDYVETVFPYLSDCDWLVFGFSTIPKGDISRITEEKVFSGAEAAKEAYLLLSGSHLFNSPCNKIYCAANLREKTARFTEDLSLGEDLLFNLAYGKTCKRILVLPNILYRYRVDSDTSLSKFSRPDFFPIQKRLKEEIDNTFHHDTAVVARTNRMLYLAGISKVKEIAYQKNTPFATKQRMMLAIMEDELFSRIMRSEQGGRGLFTVLLKHKMTGILTVLGMTKQIIRRAKG